MDVQGDRNKVGNVVHAPLTECRRCGKIGIILPNLDGMHLNCYEREQNENTDIDRE